MILGGVPYYMNYFQSGMSLAQNIDNILFNRQGKLRDEYNRLFTNHSAWSKRKDDTEGAQIDLLISRNDNVVNMCEIKYYSDKFTVSESYYQVLLHRQELLAKELSPKFAIHNTLITTFDLTYNEYSGIFANVITLEDLFKD